MRTSALATLILFACALALPAPQPANRGSGALNSLTDTLNPKIESGNSAGNDNQAIDSQAKDNVKDNQIKDNQAKDNLKDNQVNDSLRDNQVNDSLRDDQANDNLKDNANGNQAATGNSVGRNDGNGNTLQGLGSGNSLINISNNEVSPCVNL